MNTNEIRTLLGQSFFIGFEGLELPSDVEKFLRENQIGGVTLFGGNYENPAQVAELVNSIQAIPGDLPRVIAVDHEGGRVQRFKTPFTVFPPAHLIGDQDSPKLAFDCAEVMGRELAAVGVNVNFAPVADINTNPANPIIGNRAFGENEERVTKMVTAFARGLITQKVHPVVKHFPGHGDTIQDSHLHLPKISTDLKTLLERETKPFVKAFKSRCELVMTAHIVVEAVDPQWPATLSQRILQDILRGQLRFKGLIFSDDMEMKAIADNFGEVDAAVRALEAGVDILLYHTVPVETRVFEGLLSKLTSPQGSAALKNLQASNKRLTDFKKKHLLPYKPVVIPDIRNVIGCPEHLELARMLQGLVQSAKTENS